MILGIIKPKGPTSNRVLTQIKKITGIKKIGHAGTLDPLASGVLVVAISRGSTKKIAEEVKKEKEYLATIKLGAYSATDDEEGEKEIIKVSKVPEVSQVSQVINEFVGEIEQTPPVYSAIKIDGKEAYKYARKGEVVEMKKRPALIKDIQLLEYQYPILKIKVVTGPGVYIRTLARDMGERLGTGGYLADLGRTRVGDFTLENSKTLEDLTLMNFDHLKNPA